jgi:hypothetical protein
MRGSRGSVPGQNISMNMWYRQEERQTDHFFHLNLGQQFSLDFMAKWKGEQSQIVNFSYIAFRTLTAVAMESAIF